MLTVLAVVAAAVGAIIATIAVIAIISEPFGGPEICQRNPLVRGAIWIAAGFAAWLAAKVVLLNL